MATDQAAPANDGPLTIDQLTALMDAEQIAAAKPEAEEEKPSEQESEAEAEPEIEEPEEQEEQEEQDLDDADEEEEPEVKAPIPDPPQSWSKEDRAGWAELTPRARETVLRREADRDKAVSQAVQKATETLKFVQNLADKTAEIAYLATDAMTAKWGRDHDKIDWPALARQYSPQDYLALKAEYDSERAELAQAQTLAGEQAAVSRNAFMAEQTKKLAEIEPELMDPKEGSARRAKVYAWLESEGFPREVLSDLSAIELRAAYKAMRFDEMTAKAKEQAKLPRKNPTAAVKPTPKSGAGVAVASPKRDVQAASQRLTKSGRIDDLVALFDAEDAAKTRKAGQR